MIEVVERVYNFSEKLPLAPERVAFYTGITSIIEGMYNIEFGNPIVGGALTILGAITLGASVSTERAHSIIDNLPRT